MDKYIFWLLIIAYSAHILEEYFMDWKKWVYILTKINISWNDFYLINCIVIIYGVCIASIGINNLYISLTFPALMIINAIIFHILPTIIKRKYSPGLITSIILFLPLSIITFYEINKTNKIEKEIIILAFIGGFIIILYPIILNRIRYKINNKI
jgi:hypothetical protein